MATSGSKSISVTSYDTLTFNWSQSSQNIANNTTTISWSMVLKSTADGAIYSSASKSWSVTVNGTKYSGSNSVAIGNGTSKTLASGSTTITHNSDGTKTFSYSFSQQFDINFNGWVGTKSGSGSGTLNTIARKSTLTVGNGTLGSALSMTINRSSSGFTHSITYVCGNTSGTAYATGSGTSVSWTPPLTLAQQAPGGSSVSVTLTLTTYNGSTSLGSNAYTISCAIPASVVPVISSISVSDAAGFATTYGGYIQGKSKFRIAVAAYGAYGSTISSYSISANGQGLSGATSTTDVVKYTGVNTITVTVRDSRGRTASSSTTVSVQAYGTPTISSMSVYRSDASGNASSGGAYLTVQFTGSVSTLGGSGNAATWKLQYKQRTASAYTTVTVSGGKYTFAATTTATYDVILTLSDRFTSTSKSATGSPISKLISLLSRGRGIAFGKIAETADVVDFGFMAYFQKGITLLGAESHIKYYIPGVYDGSPISFYQGDETGIGVVIGDGGRTIIGSGESAHALRTVLPGNDAYEETHVASDGAVYVHTACETIANRYTFTFGGDGSFIAPKNLVVNGHCALYAKGDGEFWGVVTPDFTDVNYLRSGKHGFLPYGAAVNGIGYVGTPYWPFEFMHTKNMYADNFYTKDGGKQFFVNSVLWAGAYIMSSGNTAYLSQAISAQPHGIVVVWSRYDGNAIYDEQFVMHFIPKYMTTALPGKGIGMSMSDPFKFAHKYVYAYDTQLIGSDINLVNTTLSGVTVYNAEFVLRYVIGV